LASIVELRGSSEPCRRALAEAIDPVDDVMASAGCEGSGDGSSDVIVQFDLGARAGFFVPPAVSEPPIPSQ